ncbi:HEAT repeat domain-containing protein [Actinophytocola sp. KF-1]
MELLADPSPQVRVAALYVLGWLPAYDSSSRVRALLDGDEPDGVVATAVVALGLLGVSPTVVRPYLAHRSAAVRWAAAVALTRLGDVAAAGSAGAVPRR